MRRMIVACIAFVVALGCSAVCGRHVSAAEPPKHGRIVAVGDLPKGHDPAFVLRKGRIIPVSLVFDSDNFPADALYRLRENVYGDFGQPLLISNRATITCLQTLSHEHSRIKIRIVAVSLIEFMTNPYRNVVIFSSPLTYASSAEYSGIVFGGLPPAALKEHQKRILQRQELLSRTRKHVFLSPVMSEELTFEVVSGYHGQGHGKVIFGEDVSGDKTVIMKRGYNVYLRVQKDILFSREKLVNSLLEIPVF